ncbi:MAG: hypothetical protein CFE26_11030 [Verrucomicrobiales bacterium VVV1]|nr:MAG: hypothetical protein CFE26_11030 [Verrucomicrobiales bacterium VVV1]
MKTTINRRQGFTLVELLVVIMIIAALAALSAPMLINQRKQADLVTATSNARQIGQALLEFDNQYSSYPDQSTAQAVQDATGTQLSLTGNTSNDMFRQLLATGIAPSEELFYVKTPYTKKADNVFTTADRALSPGENGFGYLMNGNVAISSSNSARPIAVTPLLNAQTDGQFDASTFNAKAIVLRIDNSAVAYTIRPTDKQAITPGGSRTLLQTGNDTVWGTDTNPVIIAPQRKN